VVSLRPRALPYVVASLLAAVLLLRVPSGAGPHTKSSLPLSTEEHVQSPGWWPTKGTAPRADFVGTAECAKCHEQIAATQQTTPMAHASTPAPKSDILKSHTHLSALRSDFHYDLAVSGETVNFSVTEGLDSLSAPLLYAFGLGHKGQTYIYERDSQFYESRLSFYKTLQSLDLTTGHDPRAPDDLKSAMGRWMAPAEAQRCFGCHTTASTTSNHFDISALTPGVTCEACHGPGARHVADMKAGNIDAGRRAILNPRALDPVASVDFCGACHRSWSDVMLNGTSGVITARFQPYRLESSKCWRKGDVRLTCVTCHNPHENLVNDPSAYDQKCLACHQKRATQDSLNTIDPAPAKLGTRTVAEDQGTHEFLETKRVRSFLNAGREISESALVDENSSDQKAHRSVRFAAACPVETKNCVTCHMPQVEIPSIHAPFTDHNIRIVRPEQPYPD